MLKKAEGTSSNLPSLMLEINTTYTPASRVSQIPGTGGFKVFKAILILQPLSLLVIS